MREANWSRYATYIDMLIEEVRELRDVCRSHTCDIEETYTMGCRSHYIPGLSEESKSLYEAYKKHYMSNPFDSTTLDTGNKLIKKMAAENKRGWKDMITSTDLTGNNWKTLYPANNFTFPERS